MARAAVKRGLRLSVGSWNTIWMRLRSGSRAKALRQDGADVVAVEHDAAGGLVDQPHHHHRGGGLAAAGFADQADALAVADGEADAVDRAEHAPASAGGLRREQLCRATRGRALARIFLDELFDDEQRLRGSPSTEALSLAGRSPTRLGAARLLLRQQIAQRDAGPRRRAHQLLGVGVLGRGEDVRATARSRPRGPSPSPPRGRNRRRPGRDRA